ncbi:hypothetical protein HT585_27785 [Ensifer sp. HO-A22]|uniref:Uncharacterized protein n=1 Tax=Ensifer oleiphilus TaxID=2742698 RepID=A0A7Y6URD4_9HYPH|nr:hypothetical protein [Ensifer oleiphilus]NVD42678.1 hypothetical protein [Ensifer oleiphilus]
MRQATTIDEKTSGPIGSQIAAKPPRFGKGRAFSCRIDPETVLVLGSGHLRGHAVSVRADGAATLRDSSIAASWALSASTPSATRGFAALLTQPKPDVPISMIDVDDGRTRERFLVAPRPISIEEAATLIAQTAALETRAIISRLADQFMAQPTNRSRVSAGLSLIRALQPSDGFIELVGETHDGVIVIMGWSRAFVPGRFQAYLVAGATTVADCFVANFARPDLPEGELGFIAVLETDGRVRADTLKGMIYNAGGSWHLTPAHPRVQVSAPLDTPDHIRSVLLEARATPEAMLRLRSAANGFTGKDTVSSLPFPVRMDLDRVFETDGGDMLISGWLLDPENHVTAVKLRRSGTEARLDEMWTRLDRADVSQSFADQPAFRSSINSDDQAHGFVAHAKLSGGKLDAAPFLELTLREGRRAFLPLVPKRMPARTAALQQLSLFDAANWALPAIVDDQIVPLLCNAAVAAPRMEAVVDVGVFDENTGIPIIVGSTVGMPEVGPLLALLALDPQTHCAPIVIVVGKSAFQRDLVRLRQLARFYGLSVRLVCASGALDRFDLLSVGAEEVSSETIITMSGSLIPAAKGWYGALTAVGLDHIGSVISPMLAYDDRSVKWAGCWLSEGGDQLLLDRYAGYPLMAIAALQLTRVDVASLECCIMPRAVLRDAMRDCGVYLGSTQKAREIGLRINKAGIPAWLLPSIQLLGCDEPLSGEQNGKLAALAERIDAEILKSRWRNGHEPHQSLDRISA